MWAVAAGTPSARLTQACCPHPAPATSWPRPRGKPLIHCCAASDDQLARSMAALRLDSVDDMGELKLAYRERMRALHPDVNARDTTAEAAQVNLAYAELAQALVTDSLPSASRLRRDVFDTPGPAECCFVNPFTYGCDPTMWRELQGAFKQRQSDGLADEDILLQLRLAGAGSGGAGVVYLSADQLAEVEALMATLDETFDYSTVSWLLGDCLLRACRANERF